VLRWWVVFGLLAAGCATKSAGSAPPASYAPGFVDIDLETSEELLAAPGYDSRAAPSMDPAPPPPPPPPSEPMPMDDGVAMLQEPSAQAGGQATSPGPADPSETEPDAPARMVHYDGWAQIRTPRAERLVDDVVALVEEADGYVEGRGLRRVSARVPVDRFDEVWDEVLSLGPVVRRHLEADDVTDAFTDLSLRLRSLVATRDRLTELLAKATEERDKLELIKQIHRLTEQIEVMQAQVQTLRGLASLSRLTVEAVAPELHGNVASQLPAGMEWIDGLSAWSTWIPAATPRRVKLPVPDGFVRLDPRDYHLQSADGATLRGVTLRNDPQGDASFWRQAVSDRIGDQLDDGSVTTVGGWAMVRFVEQGSQEPYIWHLGFRVDGRHLQVLQLTYPTDVLEARYHDQVLSVLGGGAS